MQCINIHETGQEKIESPYSLDRKRRHQMILPSSSWCGAVSDVAYIESREFLLAVWLQWMERAEEISSAVVNNCDWLISLDFLTHSTYSSRRERMVHSTTGVSMEEIVDGECTLIPLNAILRWDYNRERRVKINFLRIFGYSKARISLQHSSQCSTSASSYQKVARSFGVVEKVGSGIVGIS